MKTIPQMHSERWQSKSDRFVLNGLLGINASQFFQGINPSSSSSSVVVVNNMSRQETHQTDGSDVSVVLRELIISGALHSLLFFLALLGATHKINYSNNKEKRKKAGSTSSKKSKKTRKNLAGTRELPSSAHPRVHPPTQPITIIKKRKIKTKEAEQKEEEETVRKNNPDTNTNKQTQKKQKQEKDTKEQKRE